MYTVHEYLHTVHKYLYTQLGLQHLGHQRSYVWVTGYLHLTLSLYVWHVLSLDIFLMN